MITIQKTSCLTLVYMQTKIREQIFQEAECAKKLLQQLKSGQHILDLQGHTSETNEKKLLQILHFRQYANMYKYAFETWDVDCLEQTYIEIANEARELHDLVEDEVYKETLFSLLIIRADLDSKCLEDTHEFYMHRVGCMWRDAGLIRDLQRNGF